MEGREKETVSVREMEAFLQAEGYAIEISGAPDACVQSFCSLNKPHSDALTWIKNVQPDSLQGFAGCRNMIVVAKECAPHECDGVCFLLTQQPKAVFFSLLRQFWGRRRSAASRRRPLSKAKA